MAESTPVASPDVNAGGATAPAYDIKNAYYNPMTYRISAVAGEDDAFKLSQEHIGNLDPSVIEQYGKTGNYNGGLPGYNQPFPNMDHPENFVSAPTHGGPLVGEDAPQSSVINTSTQSKTNYNTNVSTMNKANASIAPNGAGGVLAPSNKSGVKSNTYNADGSTDVVYNDGTKVTFPAGSAGAPSGASSGNATTGNENAGGGANGNENAGATTTDASGLDPTIRQGLQDNITTATNAATAAKTTLDDAAATMADDPAARAAVERIKGQYDVLIKAMTDKNAMIMGRNYVTLARYGGLGVMSNNFISDQMDRGIQRIGDLVQKEQDAILKSNQAYKNGDVKAFNAATTAYNQAIKEKGTAIMNLSKAVNDQVKTVQAQAKIDAKAANDEITNNVKLATNLAKTMAKAIADSGVTDEKKIDAYIKAMADTNGITDPNILKNALVKAQQDSTSLDLKNENTRSIIKKRNAGGGGSNPKFVISDAIKKVTPQFEARIAENKKNGSKDSYVAPEDWIAARASWNKAGGTDASFNTTFKKYLNPKSYDKAGFAKTGPKS